jgi:sulfite exporter TauE/SafE
MLLCERSRRLRLAAAYLAARLFAYILLGLGIALVAGTGIAGAQGLGSPAAQALLALLVGLILLRYSLRIHREECATGSAHRCGGAASFARWKRGGLVYALQTGLVSGLALCAPMTAIIAEALKTGTAMGALGTLLAFYLGTTTLLLPLLIGGFACGGRTSAIRQIGFLCGLLAAGFYLLQGLHLLTTLILHALN